MGDFRRSSAPPRTKPCLVLGRTRAELCEKSSASCRAWAVDATHWQHDLADQTCHHFQSIFPLQMAIRNWAQTLGSFLTTLNNIILASQRLRPFSNAGSFPTMCQSIIGSHSHVSSTKI